MNILPKFLPVFCPLRVLSILIACIVFPQNVSAQFAPLASPLPPKFTIMGTYYDTQDDEQSVRDRIYTLGPSTAITDGTSSGNYSYTKTGPNTGNLLISVNFSSEYLSESSQITYALTFTSPTNGTCTFSGSFSGEEDGIPYSGSVYNTNGVFSLSATAQTLDDWRQQYFDTTEDTGDAANDFDYDHDGIPNLVEYALGTSPTDASDAKHPSPSISTNGGKNYLTLSLNRPSGVVGIDYVVETSNNINGGWSSGPGSTVSITDNGSVLSVRDSNPQSASQPFRFMRLRISEKLDE